MSIPASQRATPAIMGVLLSGADRRSVSARAFREWHRGAYLAAMRRSDAGSRSEAAGASGCSGVAKLLAPRTDRSLRECCRIYRRLIPSALGPRFLISLIRRIT